MVTSAPEASHASRPPAGGRLLAAVDIGGTKIAGAVLDAGGTVLHRAQRPTPPGGGPEDVFTAVREVLEQLAALPQWGRVSSLGIASAGPVDIARGLVSPVNIPGWRGFPLVDRVRELPQAAGLPVVLCGDAVAMTAAEHRLGAARGCRDALCMVVSTGVGAGLVMDGAVRNGPTGNAGHLGHITVDLLGDPCPCGARGCVEQLASGTSLTRRALQNGWRPAGEPDGAALAADARAGDAIALASFDTSARALAAAVAAVATLVEIEVAVIGGGVAEAHDVLFPPLRRHLASYAVLPFAAGVRIEVAALRADAGLIGAALIASDLQPAGAAC
ncbi:ROK family protein [Streptomyces cocklensis]|uniref:Glucokinase n=1 Tax=Actinacidiphila cocklensis TaxID=887465 RepID=A0A9W4GVR3_9ACTN|nr:ROK family protein [Actinacidiphila cocklensis]MDD1058748.1 ROK family protein [Actinacidiphila cocklensis]CAG6398862.1 Glucokinase [Actinacidiphila cocklensis]